MSAATEGRLTEIGAAPRIHFAPGRDEGRTGAEVLPTPGKIGERTAPRRIHGSTGIQREPELATATGSLTETRPRRKLRALESILHPLRHLPHRIRGLHLDGGHLLLDAPTGPRRQRRQPRA
jgi:hypothetical protein